MTVLGIRYLTGYAVAANLATPRTAEFPPHFGRVFMAMAATYFETRGTEEERKALEWLESIGSPSISADEGSPRSFVETYVPVNDKLTGISSRSRQPRSFPTIRLDQPFVYLIWDANVPQDLHEGLRQLCTKVTRIGHSSSLVQMWLADDPAEVASWQPSKSGEHQMRTVEPGTLAYLERSFNAEPIQDHAELTEALETAKGKRKNELKKEIAERFPDGRPESHRPLLTKWQGYTKTADQPTTEQIWPGPFSPQLIVLTRSDRIEQPVMAIESTVRLTSALRDAAMKSTGANVPEWLSGHQADGSPTLKPHAAFFSLPFVGAKYADGHVMGLAMAVPREIGLEELRKVVGPLLFEESGDEMAVTLWRGNQWRWELEREKRENPPVTLRPKIWVGPAREWASVTPVVLHHYPRRNRDGDVERILMEAFDSAGLPRPVELRVQPVSAFEGAGHAKAMPEFKEGGENLCRYQTHVVVRFAMKVEGPVLVGRGRFRGYGLMRPMEVKRD